MDVTLTVERGPAQIRRIRLRAPETLIGRQKGCDIRIPSAEVSRRHCLLSFSNGQLVVEDLDSVNGTFINKERITGRQTVRAGDQLKIGPLTFSVDYHSPPTVQAHPDADADSALPDANESEPALQLMEEEAPRPPAPKAKPSPPPLPLAGSGVIPLKEDAETEEIADMEFDESQRLNLPEGSNLRDFLNEMER